MNSERIAAEIDQLTERLSERPDDSILLRMGDKATGDILLHLNDLLEHLEASALRVESDSDDETALGEIRRTLHTVKGDAGVLGLPEVSDIFHHGESLLEAMLEAHICPTDLLLKLKDWLHQLLNPAAAKTFTIGLPAAPIARADNLSVKIPGEDADRSAEGRQFVDFPLDDAEPAGEAPVFQEPATEIKTLIVEDDFTSRLVLQEILKEYGPTHMAVNGREAVEVVKVALEAGSPYQLICLDILMPEMDGLATLKAIRSMEEERGILSSLGAKIVMTTALDDLKNVRTAFFNLCDAYLEKPVRKAVLLDKLQELTLIPIQGARD